MRAEIEHAQQVYTLEKKAFFGLHFEDKNLSISVIENASDFMQEGDTLRHCLFTNEYYKKRNSLILSAKVDSQPVETIELSLKTIKIIQCRGMRNNSSKHHRRILRLLEKNLYQIKSRIKKENNLSA